METDYQKYIVTINAGSSSLKLAAFAAENAQKTWEAAVENIGQSSTRLVTGESATAVAAKDHAQAAETLLHLLTARVANEAIVAVSHRIVHGGPKYYETLEADSQTLAVLREFAAFDPEHLPIELQLVETFQQSLPQTRSVLCFDTAFHHHLPTRARLLPLPRHLQANGVRRYGFHGLSYAFIVADLQRVEGEAAANGKVIIAHLGNGVSLAALQNGKPIDTTMSMTPTSGIPMSTRSGDLDPGLLLYLAKTHGYDAERLQRMATFESGLLGISQTSADMKKLLEIEAEDPRAHDAVDIFCYNVAKTIGGFAAALGGLDTLVFSGGMGEQAPKIRTRVCDGLAFLGITLDEARNQNNERLISADGQSVGVHVIHTDEAVTMARETIVLLKQKEQL